MPLSIVTPATRRCDRFSHVAETSSDRGLSLPAGFALTTVRSAARDTGASLGRPQELCAAGGLDATLGFPEGERSRVSSSARRLVDRRSLALRIGVVRLLPAASRPLFAGVLISLLAAAVLAPALVLAVGASVGEVPGAIMAGAGSAAARRLTVDLVLVGALFTAQQVMAPLIDAMADQLGLRLRTLVFMRTMAAGLRPASISHLEDPDLRDLVTRATQPGRYGPRSAVLGLASQWSTRLSACSALILVWAFRWWAGLVMTVLVVHAVRSMRRAHQSVAYTMTRHTRVIRHSEYFRDLVLTPGAAKETRVFGLGEWLRSRFHDEWLAAMTPVWARRRSMWWAGVTGGLPLVLGIGAIAAFATHGAFRGEVSIATVVVVVQAAITTIGALSFSEYDTAVEVGASSIEALIELEKAMESPALSLAGTRSAAGLPARELRLEGVRFAYPHSSQPVLAGVDLAIPAGTSLAIVGENGAGKTTLVKLLARLYDPTGGRISVDGIDLRDVDPRSWQRQVAAVFQDFVRYPWTAADNVALRGDADPAGLDEAAALAGATAIIDSLERGWDTVLSRQFGGADLSGGQWQRIALARAIYAAAQGASLLILDEPTAQLDVRQEAEFYDRFLELTAGRTSIVISHRFSTVRRADRIAVLEEGKVVEIGSHDELAALGGRYAELYRVQAERYAEEVGE